MTRLGSDTDTTEPDMELNLEGSEGEPERIFAEDEEPTLQVTEEEDIALDLDVLELEEDDDGYEEDVEVTEDEDNSTNSEVDEVIQLDG
ncbi:hypothetical protein HDZ31DRAFT_64389 [Schizophyllum fasciatum]